MAKYELWKSERDGDYYWHLKSTNNYKVICRSSEGYENRSEAIGSIKWVKANSDAPIEEL